MRELYLRAVFESDVGLSDVSLYFHISITQKLKAMDGHTHFLLIELDDTGGSAKDATRDEINQKFDTLYVRRTDELLDDYPEINLLQKFGFALSLVAALAGALGVLNTMLLSVMERTREIGLLMAIGWSRKKIVLGVVAEGIAVTMLGGVVGVILGYLEVVGIRELFDLVVLSPKPDLRLTLYALGLALVLGLLASLYPAWRASRLTPMDALRTE